MKTFVQTTAFTLMLLLASLVFTSDSVADDGSSGSDQNTGRLVRQPPLPPGSSPIILGGEGYQSRLVQEGKKEDFLRRLSFSSDSIATSLGNYLF